MQPKYHNVDFLIITALEQELDAIKFVLSKFKAKPFGPKSISYDANYFRIEDFTIVALSIGTMGRVAAAIDTSRAIVHWRPQVVFLVGIAGGIRGKVKLGDVLIPNQIYDYELMKLITKKDKKGILRRKDVWRGSLFNVSRNLYKRATPKLLSSFWDYIQLRRPTREWRGKDVPAVHPGKVIASGDKSVAVKSVIDKIRAKQADLIGIEMEGGGFCYAVREIAPQVDYLVIRAVSDYADKSENDNTTKRWRKYVCRSAAAATRRLIEVLIEKRIYEPFIRDPKAPLKSLIYNENIINAVSEGYILVFLCDFSTYKNFAFALSSSDTDFVLWTMDGSPLDISSDTLVKRNNTLSEQDLEFSKLSSRNKLRFVIFESFNDVRKYVNAKEEKLRRRKAFEKSCKSKGGILRYSCRKVLKGEFGLPKDFHYDIGFVAKPGRDANSVGYCFHSPFSSKIGSEEMSHVSIFDAQNPNQALMVTPIPQGSNLRDYNTILSSIPFYPIVIERIQRHLKAPMSNAQNNDKLLFETSEDLYRKCRQCKLRKKCQPCK